MNEIPIKPSWEKVNITKIFYELRNEKKYIPFWNDEKKEISNNLWYPTGQEKINTIIGNRKFGKEKSWFSIKKKFEKKREFDESNFLFPEPEKNKPSPIKTLKIRIFPNKSEKENLGLIFNQFRWYYNAQTNIFNKVYGDKAAEQKKFYFKNERDRMRKYRFEIIDDKKKFIHDPLVNEFPVPEWWENVDIHNRIPRGAVKKFVMGVNSALSNFKAGNITKFKMGFLKRKYDTEFFHFEDSCYPPFIRKIKNHYCYTGKDHKRTKVELSEEFLRKRGLEVIHEKSTDRYFIHYPIEKNWFPEDDRRIEKQASFINKGNRVISLDPGIRKFLVGYDPKGKTIFIGNKAGRRLKSLLLEIDKDCSERAKDKSPILKRTIEKWKKLKNLVIDLHWKTINFLIKNYDTILLPDFRTSQMMKGRQLPKIVKRLMSMFSFHSFKEKLRWKCSLYNKRLIIVNESFTSKTCGLCGELNNIGGNEHFSCKQCKLGIDRDVNGARNILLKNMCLC